MATSENIVTAHRLDLQGYSGEPVPVNNENERAKAYYSAAVPSSEDLTDPVRQVAKPFAADAGTPPVEDPEGV